MTRRTVLVVDDDEIFGEVLGRQLAGRGFECAFAADSHRARALANLERFDCALLDLRLNEASGLSLIEPLLTSNPYIRIVVLTGYASIATAVQAVKRLEWEHIQRVLAECDGNVSAAARCLNMHRRTLLRKLARRPVGR